MLEHQRTWQCMYFWKEWQLALWPLIRCVLHQQLLQEAAKQCRCSADSAFLLQQQCVSSLLYNGRQFRFCGPPLLCHIFSILRDAKVTLAVFLFTHNMLQPSCLFVTVSFSFFWTLGSAISFWKSILSFLMWPLSACHGIRYRHCRHCLLLNLIKKQGIWTFRRMLEKWLVEKACSAAANEAEETDEANGVCCPLTPGQQIRQLQAHILVLAESCKKVFQGRLISVGPCCCH